MFLTTAILSLLSVAAATGGDGDGDYLDVKLWDAFGDGWQDAYLMISEPHNEGHHLQVDCEQPELTYLSDGCNEVNKGYYYMTVRTPDDSLPEGWWEIMWTVQLRDGDNDAAKGDVYTGRFNSTMVWYCDGTQWGLSHHENLYEEEDFECHGCTGHKCKPKPKPAPPAPPAPKGPGAGEGLGNTGAGAGNGDGDSGAGNGNGNTGAGNGNGNTGAGNGKGDGKGPGAGEGKGPGAGNGKGDGKGKGGSGAGAGNGAGEGSNGSGNGADTTTGDSASSTNSESTSGNSGSAYTTGSSTFTEGDNDSSSNGNSQTDIGTGYSESESGNYTKHYYYGPRAVDVEIHMFSEDGNGWGSIRNMGVSPKWYIADYSLTKIFDEGSLCQGWEGNCRMCLGDGSYVFRITGPTFNETLEHEWEQKLGLTVTDEEEATFDHSVFDQFRFKSWKFCHATGSFGEQLNFHISQGKCIPDNLRWNDEICDSLNSTVHATGVVALHGVPSAKLSADEAHMVVNSLASVMNGWTAEHLSLVATSLGSTNDFMHGRALTTYTHLVSFSVSFVSESFGVDGSNYGALQNLVEDMSLTLKSAFASGSFTHEIAASAKLANDALLANENQMTAELVSFKLDKVAYSMDHLVYVDEEPASTQAHPLAMSTAILVAAVASVGLVAFVGIFLHKKNAYNKLTQESEHIELESGRNRFFSQQ